MKVYTYSPSDVVLSVGGYIISGITSVAAQRNTPAFKIVRGIRGQNTRVYNKDTSAEMTVTLLQTSISNDLFSIIEQEDEKYRTGRLEISLKDTSGTTVWESDEAFIEGLPSTTLGKDLTDRTWKICMLSTRSVTTGGNYKAAPDLF